VDVLIRNLKPATKAGLVERAHRHGRSFQAEVTAILDDAAAELPAVAPLPPLSIVTGRSGGRSAMSRDQIYLDGAR